MKAVTLDSFGAQPAFRDDLPEPAAGPGDVVVRVRASSLNPVDQSIADGILKAIAEHEFPVVLGRDFAGTVETAGPAVTGVQAGDLVYGFVPPWNPRVHAGTWAERIVLPGGQFLAHVPDGVPVQVAGAAPLVILTAMAAVDAVRPRPGQTVLVVGATGGVGTAAVQLAAAAGATVIAPARSGDEAYLRDLGVGQVIDRDGDIAESLRGVQADALIDLVSYSPDGFERYAAFLKPGGPAASALRAAGEGPGRTNVAAIPAPENLRRVSALLSEGTVRIPIQATHRLEDVPAALQAFGSSHKQGKHAVTLG